MNEDDSRWILQVAALVVLLWLILIICMINY